MALVAGEGAFRLRTYTPEEPGAQPAPAGASAPTGPADMLLPKSRSAEAQKPFLRITVSSAHGEYSGERRNNLKHGKGRFIYKRLNAIYQGDWIRGKRSGYGTYDVKSPSTGEYIRVYAGNWMNNKKYGYGTYYFSKDEYYEGGWRCDLRSGWGKMLYTNGDVYEGEWSDDKYCGQGTLFLEKSRYKGSWKDGMKHGPGEFYFLDTGRLYKGLWVRDVPTCGTLENTCWAEGPHTKKIPAPELKVPNPKRAIEEDQRGHLQTKKRTTL